jgi:hypothetical protein
MTTTRHDPNDLLGQELCRFGQKLAEAEGIGEIECIANANSTRFQAYRRSGAEHPTIELGMKLFRDCGQTGLCTCGHTHRDDREGVAVTCNWPPGCDCVQFEPDGVPQGERLLRVGKALTAHEVGHLVQERDGRPTCGPAAELDADLEAARLYTPGEVIDALCFTNFGAPPDGDPAYPTGPERVHNIQNHFPG